MAMQSGSRIVGTGFSVPERVVTNEDLAQIMDTTDEWIRQRSGIERRHIAPPNCAPSDLALAASQEALARADLEANDIDLILVATLTPEHFFPGTSVFLQQKLGLETTPAMDIRCQCSGFIYGLQTAHALIVAGTYRRILLCGVEIHSRAMEFSNRGRDISVLFGDGAGSVIIEASSEPGIIGTEVHAQGEHARKLWMQYPSFAAGERAITADHILSGEILPQMDGRTVFKHAVTRMPQVVRSLLNKHNTPADDVDLFVFHQANLRINEAVLESLEQPPEKAFNNIMRYGNCSAASIPMCLAEAESSGRLKRGMLVCLGGFGAGFTWGSALIRW